MSIGYIMKEGINATQSVDPDTDFIVRKNGDGKRDLLIPVSDETDEIKCVVSFTDIQATNFHELLDLYNKCGVSGGESTSIGKQCAQQLPAGSYTVYSVGMYEKMVENLVPHKAKGWPILVDIGYEIFMCMRSNENEDWKPVSLIVDEVHEKYVTASLKDFRNVAYKLTKDTYRSVWFTDRDACEKACYK